MTISSINTNLAALLAQVNIGVATNSTSNSVAALSSGNRIVQASTDVSALATGTALQSQVNTLTTSLTVASQGSSLLQVADGALAQISNILQRQQAIATQAQSGSLSATQLGFLNQEFQSLTQEIDSLAGSTNFNGVNLINGALAGGSGITTNTAVGATSALASTTLFTFAGTGASVVAASDAVVINGVTIHFTTSAPGTTSAAGKVTVGSTTATTAANLASFLNKSGDPQFANLHFEASGATIIADYTGGALETGGLAITTSTTGCTANVAAAAASVTIAAGGTDGLGINRYSAVGTVQGTILVNDSIATNNAGEPIDTALLRNNTAFLGSFGGNTISAFKATLGASQHASFSIKAGDVTYNSGDVNLTATTTTAGAVIAATFTGIDSNGGTTYGSFKLNFNGLTPTLDTQPKLDAFVAQLNAAVSGISIYQNRDVNSFQGSGYSAVVGGIEIGTLKDATVDFHSNNFTNVNISSVTVTAPGAGTTDANISVVLNGETYSSIAGIGNQIATNTAIALQNVNDPTKIITLVTGDVAAAGPGSTTVADLSTQSNADAFAAALSNAFGVSAANAALQFQVGSRPTDTIGVSIGSSTAAALGLSGLNVTSLANAATAANTLTTAVNTVTSLRAAVGALEERFSFASSAVQNAAQNEGAAKSTLLDTDVASQSTAFATAQVQLQAGIAVLAQANQLQQNLLKLIA